MLAGLTLAGAATVHRVAQARLQARLMQADPDAIPRDAVLTAFAAAEARPVYAQHCAGCHGADLKGNKTKEAPDLTDRDWLYGEGRVADIERVILYGIRAGNGRTAHYADMPAFARPVPYRRYAVASLEPGEIHDVVEFLFVAAHKPGDRAAAARGAKIFADKGGCFDCHQDDAKGDNAIGAPNLLDDVWLRGNGSRADVFDTISRGMSGVCPAWARLLPPVTVRALAVFVHGASHGPASANSANPS